MYDSETAQAPAQKSKSISGSATTLLYPVLLRLFILSDNEQLYNIQAKQGASGTESVMFRNKELESFHWIFEFLAGAG